MRFMSDLSIIVRHMRVFADRRLADEGVSFAEQLVIMQLIGYGPSSQMQIASALELDKGAVAKTIAKLEGKGFVTAVVNESDRREKKIELTDQARTIAARMSETLAEWERVVYDGISEEDRAISRRVVARMAENSTALVKGDRDE